MARRLALGVLLLALVATAPAAGDVIQRKAAVDQRIQRLHDRIDYERAQEGVLTTKISALTGRIRTLEGQVGAASDRLTALEQDLALHRDKLDRLTQLYRLESRRLTFLRGQYREAVRRLDARLGEGERARVPERGQCARAGERPARGADPGGAGACGRVGLELLERERRLGAGAHLACPGAGHEPVRDALGTDARGDRHRRAVRDADPRGRLRGADC